MCGSGDIRFKREAFSSDLVYDYVLEFNEALAMLEALDCKHSVMEIDGVFAILSKSIHSLQLLKRSIASAMRWMSM